MSMTQDNQAVTCHQTLDTNAVVKQVHYGYKCSSEISALCCKIFSLLNGTHYFSPVSYIYIYGNAGTG